MRRGLEVDIHSCKHNVPLNGLVRTIDVLGANKGCSSGTFGGDIKLGNINMGTIGTLDSQFRIHDRHSKRVHHTAFRGNLLAKRYSRPARSRGNACVCFRPSGALFGGCVFHGRFVRAVLQGCACLGAKLAVVFGKHHVRSQGNLISLLGSGVAGSKLCPVIRLGNRSVRVTFARAKRCNRRCCSFIGKRRAARNKARRDTFGGRVTRAVGSFSKGGFSCKSVQGKLMNTVSIGVRRPLFRDRAGVGLNSLAAVPRKNVDVSGFMNSFIGRRISGCLRGGPSITSVVLRGVARDRGRHGTVTNIAGLTHRQTGGTGLRGHGLHSYHVRLGSGGNSVGRRDDVFVARKSSTDKDVAGDHSITARTMFDLHKGPLGDFNLAGGIMCRGRRFGLLRTTLGVRSKLSKLHCGGIVITASTSMSNVRVQLLVVAFFLRFFPSLVGGNRICVLRAPLFHMEGHGDGVGGDHLGKLRRRTGTGGSSFVAQCYCSRRRQLTTVSTLKPSPRVAQFGKLKRVSPSRFGRFVNPGVHLRRISLRGDSRIGRLLRCCVNGGAVRHRGFVVSGLIVRRSHTRRSRVRWARAAAPRVRGVTVFPKDFSPFARKRSSMLGQKLLLFSHVVVKINVGRGGRARCSARRHVATLHGLFSRGSHVRIRNCSKLAISFTTQRGTHFVLQNVHSVGSCRCRVGVTSLGQGLSKIRAILLFTRPR